MDIELARIHPVIIGGLRLEIGRCGRRHVCMNATWRA